MTFKNKKKGIAAESRYLYSNWLGRYAGSRYYASLGIFDMIFIDKDLITRFVQLKYSSNGKPKISKKEIFDIQTWIDQNSLKGVSHIWVGIVLWQARTEPNEIRLN